MAAGVTWAGWALAGVLAVAHLLRRRGDWQVWQGHVPVHTGLSLSRGMELCVRAWSSGPPGDVRLVARMGGVELVSIGYEDYAALPPGVPPRAHTVGRRRRREDCHETPSREPRAGEVPVSAARYSQR